MMDRYILNKCEDMVFDIVKHDEIFPDELCRILNQLQWRSNYFENDSLLKYSEIEKLKAENKEMRELLTPMAKGPHKNKALYDWWCREGDK